MPLQQYVSCFIHISKSAFELAQPTNTGALGWLGLTESTKQYLWLGAYCLVLVTLLTPVAIPIVPLALVPAPSPQASWYMPYEPLRTWYLRFQDLPNPLDSRFSRYPDASTSLVTLAEGAVGPGDEMTRAVLITVDSGVRHAGGAESVSSLSSR